MSQAQTRLTQILPGPLVAQRNAIVALLQRAFPPSLFQFKDMPSRLDKAAWRDLVNGNQPFLGLGFNGMKPLAEGGVLAALGGWTLLVAVRGNGTPAQRFYGDAQKPGVLSLAPIAAAILHGQIAATGSVAVTGFQNVMSSEWDEDCAVVQIDLQIPLRLPLYDAVSQPPELGLFQEMAEQWATPGPLGNIDTYASDWKNPNE